MIQEVDEILNQVKKGDTLPKYQETIDEKKYRKYNRLIREINPIHFNEAYAQKLGYQTIVIAGNYLFTFIPKWLADWVGQVRVIKHIDIKFDTPVYPNDTIIHTGEVTDIKEDGAKKRIICRYVIHKKSGERTAYGKIILSEA